jgi:ornithine carbamoyltransferase
MTADRAGTTVNASSRSAPSLRGRDLLSVADLGRDDVEAIFARAVELRTEHRERGRHAELPLAGRSIALLFQHPSLRTRVTFEAGMTQLGGHAIYLAAGDVGLGARETVPDVALNLERFVDGIVVRHSAQEVLVELAERASIPVVNALTLREHPCQALADVFTLVERFGRLDGVVIAFVGDANNVFLSLALLATSFGAEVRLAHPPGYGPDERTLARMREHAAAARGRIVLGNDPREMARGAAVLYTDAWTSMGQEAEAEARRDAFRTFRIDRELLAIAGPETVVMHCLPAHRGEEIESEVMDGPQSVIFEQSENRLHVQKALLVELLPEAR